MSLALLAAFGAALCYGTATILQAVGAQRTAASPGVDPLLLLRLATSAPFLLGLLLDSAGFLLAAVALRRLPLFVVQAAVAANLAVVAALAAALLHSRLRRWEWAAVGVVVAGLALVASAAEATGPARMDLAGRGALLGVSLLLAVLAVTAGRRLPPPLLGAAAGLGFGLADAGARVLADPSSLAGLATDPASYAMAVGALTATLQYATALQRGSVTVATAASTTSETLPPALLGVLLFGDATRPGFAPAGLGGFALAVVGALALARFGDVEPA